jgi:hypothetical protein
MIISRIPKHLPLSEDGRRYYYEHESIFLKLRVLELCNDTNMAVVLTHLVFDVFSAG